MKEYDVLATKSMKHYRVLAKWKEGHNRNGQVDTFCNEKEALDHAQWWTNKSGRKDHIQSVEVSHIIRLVVAK